MDMILRGAHLHTPMRVWLNELATAGIRLQKVAAKRISTVSTVKIYFDLPATLNATPAGAFCGEFTLAAHPGQMVTLEERSSCCFRRLASHSSDFMYCQGCQRIDARPAPPRTHRFSTALLESVGELYYNLEFQAQRFEQAGHEILESIYLTNELSFILTSAYRAFLAQ